MTDAVTLCNLALDQINARTAITGINPPSPPNNIAAQVASRTYQQQVNAVFRAANWNCARRQVGLTLLKAALGTSANPDGTLPQPPYPWLYEYAYPDDCLKVRFLFPLPQQAASSAAPLMTNGGVSGSQGTYTAMPFVPAIDADASGNQIRVILTNAPRAQCVYTGRIDNPDLWDDLLKNAVVGALSAWFCSPVTGDDKKTVLRTQITVEYIKQARIADGNEGITSVDAVPDWMDIRNLGSSCWGLNNLTSRAGTMGGWDSWGGPDGASY